MNKAPIIGIHRLRVGRDGDGVTTLVGFHGCPLRCQYCLNPQCHKPEGVWRTMTPEDVCAAVKIDDIYFQSTGGGICFGGGEPTLYADFILTFKSLCPPNWRITIETSLNAPVENVKRLISAVDQWIIDVKDMNEETYLEYTGKNNIYVIRNLMQLAPISNKCLIRLPLIPGFNTQLDADASALRLKELGFTNFEYFNYTVNPQNLKK